MRKVAIIKLITSEECICEVVKEDDNFISIKNPFNISPDPTGSGIMLYPFTIASLSIDDSVYEIRKNTIIMTCKAPERLESQYLEKTSGIVIPTQAEKQLIFE